MKVLVTGSSGLTGSEAVTHFGRASHQVFGAGDHICYISDLTKMQTHFPNWRITVSLDQILEKMAQAPM